MGCTSMSIIEVFIGYVGRFIAYSHVNALKSLNINVI
jgi:hypothetical protein